MTMPDGAMPWLVGYYGVFQAGHLVLNFLYLGGMWPIQDFPPPPPEGWHPQATALWTSMGLIDTAIAVLALYFVAEFFGGRRRALWGGARFSDAVCVQHVHLQLLGGCHRGLGAAPRRVRRAERRVDSAGPAVRGAHFRRAGSGPRGGACRDIVAMSRRVHRWGTHIATAGATVTIARELGRESSRRNRG